MNELTHERYANFYTDFSLAERRDYRESQKDFWDLYAVTETAEKKGRAEGEAIGIAKGEAIGRTKEKMENARRLKANGVPAEIIASSLSISIDDVEAL